MRTLVAVTLIVLMAACSGPVHRIGAADGAPGLAYLIGQQQADEVLARAMLRVFPDVPVERGQVPAPYLRYQARMIVALDSHVIVATAIPVNGGNGGYTFEVSDHGSLLIRGPARAAAVTEEINKALHSMQPNRR